MRIRPVFLFFLLISSAIHQSTQSGTILSARGIGTPFLFPNTRSMGMGYISVAEINPFTISRINPAGLYFNSLTSLSLQYVYENNRYQDPKGRANSQYSNFDGFTFVLPFGSGTGMSIGLTPFTRVDYQLTFPTVSVSNVSYTKSVKGEGGLNNFYFSFFWGVRSNLVLGFSGHYLFGNTEEKWRVDYEGAYFLPSINTFSTKNWGLGCTGGVIYRPFSFLSVGAIFTPQTNLKNHEEFTFASYTDTTKNRKGTLTLPSSWGVGTSFYLGEIGQIGIEWNQTEWRKLAMDDQPFEATRNTHCISIGGEIRLTTNPLASYLKRMAYRFGFSYQPYYYRDPNRNTLNEQWITIGFGLPLLLNIGQCDIALNFGRRGSIEVNGLAEKLFRLSISLTGYEKWFIRRY